jgi:signal peptidase II
MAAVQRHWRLPHWLMLAALIVVFDQGSKSWALENLAPGAPVALTPFVNFVLVFNPGAAFSFLAGADGWQRWFFTGLALLVSAWIVLTIRRHPEAAAMNLSLSLILGGAIGNVIDRLRLGAVVDFIDVHAAGWHWPAFNVADSAITVGALLLVWTQFRPAPEGHADSPK